MDRTYAAGGWAGTRPAPTMDWLPAGATLVFQPYFYFSFFNPTMDWLPVGATLVVALAA